MADRGSPPRVRSRPWPDSLTRRTVGITSACAEQTRPTITRRNLTWDHLRVCGADGRHWVGTPAARGSPPRVRSRRVCVAQSRKRGGITSACAEQTARACGNAPTSGDHLRVCGADATAVDNCVPGDGSPPRVRSRLPDPTKISRSCRITSACAEQTPRPQACNVWKRDHLRVCGADGIEKRMGRRDRGSPPRVRSRRDLRLQ